MEYNPQFANLKGTFSGYIEVAFRSQLRQPREMLYLMELIVGCGAGTTRRVAKVPFLTFPAARHLTTNQQQPLNSFLC